MKPMKSVVLAIITMVPLPVLAQARFDGTWKIDAATIQFPSKPFEMTLQNGAYKCTTCVPPFTVPADGADHAISGNPYVDSVAMTIVNDHKTSEIDKKGGRIVVQNTMDVAAGGKTASYRYVDSSNSNAAPVTGEVKLTQVTAGPPGAHATSGAWRGIAVAAASDNGMTESFKMDGGRLVMSQPTGQSYTAPLDGTDAPYKGDPGITSVSVMKTGDATIVETDKRDGKVVGSVTMTVAPDGKTMRFAWDDTLRGSSGSYTADRQ